MGRTNINIQDRTNEFQSILQQQKKLSHSRQSLLTPQEKQNGAVSPSRQRSAFAKSASGIGRSISGTMGKLARLTELVRRKTLFDDKSVEINELTFIIKQDLAKLDQEIRQLKVLAQPKSAQDQVGKHNENVVFLLGNSLAQATTAFKSTLEERTKSLAASRARMDNFTSTVSSHSNPASRNPSRSDSPFYQITPAARSDILSLEPDSGSSALARAGPASQQQLMMLEEGAQSNSYIQERGQAIDAIERTMTELGGIFSQLAEMVSQQGEQIQRIDADTDAVVENVEGAQRELLKYWNRMSGNRWLVAKMFGVLMIFFLLWVLIAG